MEIVVCSHREHIEQRDGKGYGTCTICGQVRVYDSIDTRAPVQIIKLGRLDGRIVLPHPKEGIAGLSPQETKDLKLTKAQSLPVMEPPLPTKAEEPKQAPLYISERHKGQRGIRKWKKCCKACELAYVHDEVLWCSSKRCSKGYPQQLRTQYRPKVEATTGIPVPSGRDWYQSHKAEMIEDLITMGQADFYKKWNVKRQIITHLKSDDLYKQKTAKGEKVQSLAVPKTGAATGLPQFPEWAPEKWASSEIAVQWLKTYGELARLAEDKRQEKKEEMLAKASEFIDRVIERSILGGGAGEEMIKAKKVPVKKKSLLAKLFKIRR